MTAEQIKSLFHQRRITFTRRAEQNDHSRKNVYRVLNGQSKATFGKGHEIAIKLGIKTNETAT